jgi:hypothetical protein
MSVGAPGTVKVPVRATGSKRKKLARTGTVAVKLALTFTPTGGDPNTRLVKLKLLLER